MYTDGKKKSIRDLLLRPTSSSSRDAMVQPFTFKISSSDRTIFCRIHLQSFLENWIDLVCAYYVQFDGCLAVVIYYGLVHILEAMGYSRWVIF